MTTSDDNENDVRLFDYLASTNEGAEALRLYNLSIVSDRYKIKEWGALLLMMVFYQSNTQRNSYQLYKSEVKAILELINKNIITLDNVDCILSWEFYEDFDASTFPDVKEFMGMASYHFRDSSDQENNAMIREE